MIETALGLLISIISFFVCILTANYLGKTSYFSFLESRKNRFGSVDGVRGFLALSVFFHHFIITYYWKVEGSWKRPPSDLFQNFGKVGVVIFFMITGFLFLSKILNKDQSINWAQLYNSRIFRIVPLYFFSLVIITLIVFTSSNYQINVTATKLLKEFIGWGGGFGGTINGFSETKLINSGVDWSLRYEWLFYFSLPIIAFLINKLNRIGISLLLFGSISLFISPISNSHLSTEYIIYFFLGGGAYFITDRLRSFTENKDKLISILILGLTLFLLFYPYTLDIIHVTIIFILFLLIVSGNNLFGLLSLRSSIVLGEISYSIYLLHGIVLYIIFSMFKPISFSDYSIYEYLLFMPLLSVLVVIFSAITYLAIEKPFIDIGRKFNLNKIKNRIFLFAKK
jgi:peptidoglycan/LPS O-acetylase OafA/YrhL